MVLLLSVLALLINVSDVSAANSTFNTTSVSNSAVTVQKYVETNHKISTNVTVANHEVTSAQYLYLLTSTLQNINKSSTKPVTLKNVSYSSNPSETMTSGTLTKTEYFNMANRITTFINTYGRLPNYVTTSLGNMRYENLIYTYSKIMVFYKTYNRLPNYVSITAFISSSNNGTGYTSLGHGLLNGLTGYTGLQTLENYIHKYLNHAYGAATTAAGVEKTGLGDCWGLSAWTAQVLHDNGYLVRIVTGATSEASNHRWVQVLMDGKWVSFDPSACTPKYGCQPYTTVWASVSAVIATYT